MVKMAEPLLSTLATPPNCEQKKKKKNDEREREEERKRGTCEGGGKEAKVNVRVSHLVVVGT